MINELKFPNHGIGRVQYDLRLVVRGSQIEWAAVGDDRLKYQVSVERSSHDGWHALEVSDSGSGAIIVDDCPTYFDAAQWALLFVACFGGIAVFDR